MERTRTSALALVSTVSGGMLIAMLGSAFADTWDVAKYLRNSCVVKPTMAFDPAVTGVLATKPTAKEACGAAKALINDEPNNTNGCPSFQQVTLDKCKGLGVILK